jgi:aryl-alcohol dehydrogenase-like predicted oxidoreductase
MQTRRIGTLTVSAVGLGCNNFGMRIDDAQTRAVVDAALDSGITFFDTADIYGGTKSEQYLGRALGARRKDAVVATKFGMEVAPDKRGARPEYVHQACADSLERLGTDYIDLYWLHQPDDSVPIAETLGALDELVTQGKVRQIGCSNFSATQLREAQAEARRLGSARFVAVQNEFSLLHREPLLPEPAATASAEPGAAYPNDGQSKAGVLDACGELDMAFVPYFPLASGLLSGKYHAGQAPPAGSRLAGNPRAGRFLNDDNLAAVERLRQWVQHYQAPPGLSGIPAGNPSGSPLIPSASAPGFTLLPTEPAGIQSSAGNYDVIAGRPAGPAESQADAVGLAAGLTQPATRHYSLLDLAIAWLLAQPHVASVIAGATQPEQVRANAAAAQWHLSPAEAQAVLELVRQTAPARG